MPLEDIGAIPTSTDNCDGIGFWMSPKLDYQEPVWVELPVDTFHILEPGKVRTACTLFLIFAKHRDRIAATASDKYDTVQTQIVETDDVESHRAVLLSSSDFE